MCKVLQSYGCAKGCFMKNTLTIAITTTSVYEFKTTQPTADLALDEYVNNSGTYKKFLYSTEGMEIQDFKLSQTKKRKPTKETHEKHHTRKSPDSLSRCHWRSVLNVHHKPRANGFE